MNKLIKALTSLNLTLISLILYLIIVFMGTLAQVEKGIYYIQKEYFQAVFITKPLIGELAIPIFPGGYLIGGLVVINLTAVLLFKMKWKAKNTGLILSHIGLLILILGSAGTGLLATESQMKLYENSQSQYSEDFYQNELTLIEHSATEDIVTAIDQKELKTDTPLHIPNTPLWIKVHAVYDNTQLNLVDNGDLSTSFITEGIGKHYQILPMKRFKQENTKNNTTAIIEIGDHKTSLGIWLVALDLDVSQTFSYNNRSYSISIRPKRYYYPFSLFLQDFKHDVYPGTSIPKNFSSLVTLTDARHSLVEETKIYMNHPLRYDQKTFYQASFGENDTLSILQVVDNPFWKIPYISCFLMSFGLILHFLIRLFQKRISSHA